MLRLVAIVVVVGLLAGCGGKDLCFTGPNDSGRVGAFLSEVCPGR